MLSDVTLFYGNAMFNSHDYEITQAHTLEGYDGDQNDFVVADANKRVIILPYKETQVVYEPVDRSVTADNN